MHNPRPHLWRLVRAALAITLLSGPLTGSCEAPAASIANEGLVFRCSPKQLLKIQRDMASLLDALHIDRQLVAIRKNPSETSIAYTLRTPVDDTSTLDLIHRPEYWITETPVALSSKAYGHRLRRTVSRKEILIALMQHGRSTLFEGQACAVGALDEHLRLRQHIVAYAEDLEFQWPEGGEARWNRIFWNRSVPREPTRLHRALADMLTHSRRYSIGCYLAAKATYTFAILDFYRQQKNQTVVEQEVLRRLSVGDSLFDQVEPAAMWSFEADFDPANAAHAGKLLKLQRDVAPKNFIPGDWVYFYNTDPHSHAKTGYEGSNSIYLGRGLFVDFYNDVEHKYTYEQKLAEVYQWRHGVFSHSRDYTKSRLLSKQRLEELSQPPSAGGLIPNMRAIPYLFGHESMPSLTPAGAPSEMNLISPAEKAKGSQGGIAGAQKFGARLDSTNL